MKRSQKTSMGATQGNLLRKPQKQQDSYQSNFWRLLQLKVKFSSIMIFLVWIHIKIKF
jgi:hypothetical protein